MARPTPWRTALVVVAFLFSGASALVYQVVWQRILALHTGMGVTSVALIVSAFMAGLGFGSQAGGVLSTRVSARAALRLFAAIEIGIGLFAAISCRLYYEGPTHVAWLYKSTLGMGLAHFVALLVPTTLMGLSLPFLTRALVRDQQTASRTVALLYGVNTLGAGLGALLAPWVLIRFFGMEAAVLFGVAGNVGAGLAALLAGAKDDRAEDDAGRGPAGPPAPGAPLAPWMALYALSGFLALSLEILWFRILDIAVKSTAFTFGTVLCFYLLGLGGGSVIGALRAHRIERPLTRFLTLQCALLLYSAFAVALLGRLPTGTPGYRWFFSYWAMDDFFKLGADWDPAVLGSLYFVLPVVLYGPPTVLMGLSFSALQKAVHDDPRTSGRKVGFLQAANILGCVLGSLTIGLVLLDRVGTTGALRVLLGLGLVFVAVLARQSRSWILWAAGFALAFITLPGQSPFWTRLHGVTETARPSFIGEDATAVSAVVPGGEGRWRVLVNGLPHSWIPFEGIHTLLGAVPALIHPAPTEVAVIGLGSGETAWAVACRPEIQKLHVFEIAAAQPRLLREVAGVTEPMSLHRFLQDPRLQITIADGRHALLRSEARYDIVQVDALYRTSAMSGNLYSVEFFKLCASRLKPGGLVCSQAPSRRAALTFAAALPYAFDLGGNIVVGSNEPLEEKTAEWLARLDRVADYFGPEAALGIRERLKIARPLRGNLQSKKGINLDLYPRDEFQTPLPNER
jgi:hypothetical protein